MQLSEQFQSLPWGECLLSPVPVPKRDADDIRRHYGGTLPQWVSRLHSLPWLTRAMLEMTTAPTCHISLDLGTLVHLVVTQDNACRYCYGTSRAVLQLMGHNQEHVLAVERDLESADLSAHDRAVLAWARRLSRSNPRPSAAERKALLDAGCSAGEVAEISFVAAAGAFANRVITMLAMPAESGFEEQVSKPLMRILRPLIGWQMRRKSRAKPIEPLSANGPAGRLVAALGDTPGARVVRHSVDGMMESTVLPARTKMLLASVIARALGCEATMAEARPRLYEAGLEPDDLENILANLASPKLDSREAALVPFARETVRYQPFWLQQRMREISRGLAREEVLELVGVTALANALARLSVLLETC